MREENNKSVEAKPMCGWWPTCFSLNGSTQSVQLLIVHRKVKDGGDKKRQASLADVLFSSQSPHFHLCVFFLPATTSNEKTCVYGWTNSHLNKSSWYLPRCSSYKQKGRIGPFWFLILRCFIHPYTRPRNNIFKKKLGKEKKRTIAHCFQEVNNHEQGEK